jgi:hypothetical protein
MPCRAVHFAIDDAQLAALLRADDDAEVAALVETIEEAWDRDHLVESDKAWDAMHRCLTNGNLESHDDAGHDAYPLTHVILGGRDCHQDDAYIVALKTANQVRDIARAVVGISEAWMRERYFRLLGPAGYEGDLGEDDFGYTWAYFTEVRDFYVRAARDSRAVIFTVDQ